MNTKSERGQATKEQLLAIATRLFAERGYEETSIELVLQESGASRGALYYHFKSKEALFEAVLDGVEEEVMGRLQAAMAGATDILAAIRAACLGWIHLAGDPVVQRIVLVDAPSVLGWQRWREMDEGRTLGQLKASLGAVARMGRLDPALVDVMAHVWLAALDEIAMYIARADDREAAMRQGEAAVDTMLRGLLGG